MKKLITQSIMLLSLLLLVSFEAKAQNYFDLVLTNNTNCDITVDVYDNSVPGVLLLTASVSAMSSNTVTCTLGRPANMRIRETGSTTCFFFVPPQALSAVCGSPPYNCTCCIGGVSVTASQTGPVGPPPGSCGTLGFLYTQNLTFN